MSQPFVKPSFEASALLSILGRVSNLMGAGDHQSAIDTLLSAQALVRRELIACNTLAYLLLQVDRPQEAVLWFDAALALRPDSVEALTGRGMALQTTGDFVRALQCYEKVIAVRAGDAGSWYHHGAVLFELGRLQEALESIDRAIALRGDYALAFAKRSQVLEPLGHLPHAVEAAFRCCELLPDEVSAWVRLGDLLQTSGRLDQAVAAYDRGLTLSPGDFYCLCNKAQALKQAGLTQQALTFAQAALRADPGNREAFLLCGNLEFDLGNGDAARACFRAVAGMGAARSYPAACSPAKFRAAMLFSPLAGNTPYEDLIKGGDFDTDVFVVLPDHRYDPETVGAGADVIVNLVSETDLGLEVIASVTDLANSLGKPIVNHPDLVIGTDRESVSRRLAGISGAVMPSTLRIEAADLKQALEDGEVRTFPLIVRHAGTHGGAMMELVAGQDALLEFVDEAGDQALYLTDYIDYRSADGHFRKYRFIFVGEEILPYHLAISEGWKVHHASTRMAEMEWMRNEEQAFLDEPGRVFGKEAMAALDAIRREIGLDYFGIDCALDSAGRVVVFEVNASMLIHLHNEGFEYKTPHVKAIKAAFERLLERRSNEGKTRAA